VNARRALQEPAVASPHDGGVAPQSARRPLLDGRTRRSIQLFPGQIVVSREPVLVTTILGSCVAVCLFDAEGIGGVNHFMLPHGAGSGQTSARFGAIACARLVEQVVALGSERRSLVAKIFGGACVLESLRGSGGMHLGLRNVEVADAVLAEHGIPVVAREIGGARGRKLVFVTDTGTAWVQEIVPVSDGA
jgi:chemotaxis protein CheD